MDFILYFEKNYDKYFSNEILKYDNISQAYRSNSILESYNNRLKKLIKTKCSWHEFVKALKKEE